MMAPPQLMPQQMLAPAMVAQMMPRQMPASPAPAMWDNATFTPPATVPKAAPRATMAQEPVARPPTVGLLTMAQERDGSIALQQRLQRMCPDELRAAAAAGSGPGRRAHGARSRGSEQHTRQLERRCGLQGLARALHRLRTRGAGHPARGAAERLARLTARDD